MDTAVPPSGGYVSTSPGVEGDLSRPEQDTEVVVVLVGGCRYALPMSAVAEVGRPPSLTRVPGVPVWVAGVANWRGRVLGVLDLLPLLSTDGPTVDRKGRLVVLSRGPVTVGLLTGGVEGTLWVDPDAVEPALAHLSESAGSLLSGQFTDAAGPCGVVDLDALFALADQLPRVRRAG